MKYLLFFSLLVWFQWPGYAYSQKLDNVWLFGRNSDVPEHAGTIIDFNMNPPDLFLQFWDAYFYQTNASICDTAGNLLFYTNGIYVANALHEPMENGGGLNPGAHADAHSDDGYILDQGAMILPVPENDSLYYLLHMDKIVPDDNEGEWFSSKYFYYTLVNMNVNDGIGTVVVKNQIIKEGVFELGKLTATRHANGRDWWIILRHFNGNRYYRFLVTPSGIFEKPFQDIGESIPSPGVGQAVFSPDGTKFANLHLVNGIGTDDFIGIYDFDRCTGTLSNPNIIAYSDSAWAGGVAISPNSRYLYVSSYLRVFQYDLWSDDIAASQDTVAEWDGFVEDDFFATTFYLAQLAPDGKIYINSNNSVSYLHVIEQPNLPGDSCQVCQHCIDLPTWNAFSMPNFPHYRLGHLEGSPCDTLRQPPTAAFGAHQAAALLYTFQDSSYHDIRTWHWDFGDGHTDSIPQPTHLYESEGDYNVCLSVTNPRGADTLCQVVQVSATGAGEATATGHVAVLPNPASEVLYIRASQPFLSQAYIRLYDITGKEALTAILPKGSASLSLDISGLAKGVYIVEVAEADGRTWWRERVVVQR